MCAPGDGNDWRLFSTNATQFNCLRAPPSLTSDMNASVNIARWSHDELVWSHIPTTTRACRQMRASLRVRLCMEYLFMCSDAIGIIIPHTTIATPTQKRRFLWRFHSFSKPHHKHRGARVCVMAAGHRVSLILNMMKEAQWRAHSFFAGFCQQMGKRDLYTTHIHMFVIGRVVVDETYIDLCMSSWNAVFVLILFVCGWINGTLSDYFL